MRWPRVVPILLEGVRHFLSNAPSLPGWNASFIHSFSSVSEGTWEATGRPELRAIGKVLSTSLRRIHESHEDA